MSQISLGPQTADAIAKAEIAQKSWAARTGKERANILRRWYDLMMENADDLATILTAEQGKPLAESKGAKLAMEPPLSNFSPKRPSGFMARPFPAISPTNGSL